MMTVDWLRWCVLIAAAFVVCGSLAESPVQGAVPPPPHLSAVIDEIQAVTSHCTAAHHLTPEQLGQLRAPATSDDEDESAAAATFRPAANLQCFALCMLERAGLIAHPAGLQTDRLIEVSVLHGKDAAEMQSRLTRCRPLYRVGLDCAGAWALYVCLTQ